MEVQSGHVAERPFARLIFNTARQRFTGDLILEDNGIRYTTSWEDGRVVAAKSPAPSDSVARVALNAGLVNSSLLGRHFEELKRNPKNDETNLLASMAELNSKQILLLKRRLLAQRSMRQFALPNAHFILNNARTMVADPETPALDSRWLIFNGVKTHYQLSRLEREMAPVFGRRFQVATDAGPSVEAFGFTRLELAAVHQLGKPMSADELVESASELDRTTVLAIVYAMVATDCLSPAGAAPSRPRHQHHPPRPRQQSNPLTEPAATKITREELDAMRMIRSGHHAAVPPVGNQALAEAAKSTARRRGASSVAHSRKQRVSTGVGLKKPDVVRASDIVATIAAKRRLVDDNADHFRLLGVPFTASERDIRRAYFDLAKRLHPDRLRAHQIADTNGDGQRVFAAINTAFSVLSDRRRAAEYKRRLESSFSIAQTSDADAEQLAAQIFAAEEAFRLGEMALRRNHFPQALANFDKALELNPDEGEHHALVAWTQFCIAANKNAVLKTVNEGLKTAVKISPNNPKVHLLRGRVAAQVGDNALAARSYRAVLSLDPKNVDAQMGLRVLGDNR